MSRLGFTTKRGDFMKKVLSVILSALMLFLVTACGPEDKNCSNVNDSSQIITSSSASQEKESDDKKTDSDDKNSNKTQNNSSKKDDENKTNVSKPSLHTHTPHINDKQDTDDTAPNDNSNNNDKDNTDSVDNGVLEKASSEDMNVPENMKLLGTNNAKEKNNAKLIEARVTIYELDGDVVEWITEKDLLYVITKGNNILVVIDSKTMVPKYNTPLAGKPAEVNLVGDKVYVSMPDLCRIDIFSKANLTKVSSLSFDHEVSSFCVDGDYIYYSEHDQHCAVYKKNLTTNKLEEPTTSSGKNSFYYPKLYLNKEDNILYIGETATSGSALYYYDATTLKMKGVFRKNNYGIFNHTKSIFHIDDEIFWGNYRFSDTDIKQIIGKYGEDDTGSVNFASKQLVSTYEGVFLTETYECIINYFDAKFEYEYILITESKNFFFRQRSFDKNIILGVNFSIQ